MPVSAGLILSCISQCRPNFRTGPSILHEIHAPQGWKIQLSNWIIFCSATGYPLTPVNWSRQALTPNNRCGDRRSIHAGVASWDFVGKPIGNLEKHEKPIGPSFAKTLNSQPWRAMDQGTSTALSKARAPGFVAAVSGGGCELVASALWRIIAQELGLLHRCRGNIWVILES